MIKGNKPNNVEEIATLEDRHTEIFNISFDLWKCLPGLFNFESYSKSNIIKSLIECLNFIWTSTLNLSGKNQLDNKFNHKVNRYKRNSKVTLNPLLHARGYKRPQGATQTSHSTIS